MRNRAIGVGLIATLLAGQAVGAPTAAGPAEQLHQLQDEVRRLEAQQQQILDGLDELKKLVVKATPGGQQQVKAPDKLSVAGEQFRGDAAAKLVLIEYADFECPFCRRFEHETYPQIRDAYINTGKMKYIYRDFPLAFHEHAMPAAQAARCAAEQGKFWEMHDSLFAEPAALTSSDVDKRAASLGMDVSKLDACVSGPHSGGPIQKSMTEAQQMQINGTPTFFIGVVDGNGDVVSVKRTLVGAYPFDAFKAAIDPLLPTRAAAAGGPPTVLPR